MRYKEITYNRSAEFREMLKEVSAVRFQKDWRKVDLEFKDCEIVTVICKDIQQSMHLIEDLYTTNLLDLDTAAKEGLRILHEAMAEAENESEPHVSQTRDM